MRTAEWGEGYDVVLIFNVIHNATEPEAQQLMRKALAALRPGGTLAVLESAYRQTSGDLDAASGFGELFFSS